MKLIIAREGHTKYLVCNQPVNFFSHTFDFVWIADKARTGCWDGVMRMHYFPEYQVL